MNRFAYTVLLSVSFLGPIVPTALAVAELPVYEFSFWPGPDAEFDRRVDRVVRHPCGTVAIARVTSIPPLTNQTLQPEKVVEFSPAGEVLRRWAIPVDTLPIALKGNRLLISAGSDRFWIGVDGSIATENTQISTSRPDRSTCETLGEEFVNSDYAHCSSYSDLESGQSRILGYEGICS